MKVSILIPVYNEEESLGSLYQELAVVVADRPWECEIIMVDDGSTDRSAEVIAEIAEDDPRVRLVEFARNYGQTAAILAGIDHATGDVLVPMDADLQNDPADIPRLLDKIQEGYDVVSGWRKDRQDKLLTRRIPSMIANKLISRWTGVELHDYGCTLKAYRATALKGIQLYGEMHRFIPVYASWRGNRVIELVVNHRARMFGESKYGLGRTFKVILDLLTVKFLSGYTTKPAYWFGGAGATLLSLGLLAALGVVIEKVFFDVWVHKMTVLLLSTFLVTNGVVLLSIGLLAELVVRIYHGDDHKTYVLASELHRHKTERPPPPPPPPDAA